ncbi:hypothetical protein [Senegalia massiliensis]|uniref:Uncharacterized protein n=1 Tax=Senegalia massiliensis TaxID=1720316 RepID=A0A845QTS2_9CLOT|nr:hypothetical protein [Senegalia massiliensis]NBI05935.1 hypothetical protein [Senegalia massiliensis]
MKEYNILKILDKFKILFTKMGIDYSIMREILKIKLTLDTRRQTGISQSNNTSNADNEGKNQFLRSLPVYVLLGLPIIFFIFVDSYYLFPMSIVFGLFMFFMMTSLISDFSSVLLDVRDKNIILTKPVNSITLNMAKVLHISYYVSMVTGALVLPSLVVSIFRRGIAFFLLYLFTLILLDLFIIMITALLYLVILKLFSGEKLKDIINYVQIGLAITITLSYQIIGRLFSITELLEINFDPTWWSGFLPPVWFASLFEFIFNNSRDPIIILYSIFAIVIPIISIIIYIKLIPSFERNLQKLNAEDTNTKKKHRFTHLISNIICKTRSEKNFFNFASNIMRNERNFKLRVYPNLGFSIIFPFIMSFGSGISSILSIYFIGFSLVTILQLLKYSDSYKASWIYNYFRIDKEIIYKATLKSVYVNFITPIFILVSIIFFIILKENIIIDLIIAYTGLYLGLFILFKTGKKTLPFSEQFGAVKEKGSILDAFKLFLTIGILAGLHYLSGKVVYGKYVYIIILLIANIFAWKYGLKEDKNYTQQYN